MTMLALPSGRAIDLADPSTYEFTVDEIAEGLSRVKRFNGVGFSVLRHSIIVADTVFSLTSNPYYALQGLLHDVAEAYLGDLADPIKQLLPDFVALEEVIKQQAFGQLIPHTDNVASLGGEPIIKLVDAMAMCYELRELILIGDYTLGTHGLFDKYSGVDLLYVVDSVNRYEAQASRLFTEKYQHYCSLAYGENLPLNLTASKTGFHVAQQKVALLNQLLNIRED